MLIVYSGQYDQIFSSGTVNVMSIILLPVIFFQTCGIKNIQTSLISAVVLNKNNNRVQEMQHLLNNNLYRVRKLFLNIVTCEFV